MGAEVSLSSPTQLDVTITVNDHTYVAYIIGDMQMGQIARSYDIMEVYARKSGGQLMDEIEDDLFSLWSGLTANTAVGDTSSVISDLDVRQSIRTLDALNYPLKECAWFLHPRVYWDQLLAIQKYYDQSQYSVAYKGAVVTGTLTGTPLDQGGGFRGTLYGSPVFVTENVVSGLQTYRNLFAHKTAFGYAIQTPGGEPVRTRPSEWLANLGVLVVHDVIKGTGEVRDAAAVVVNANTTATTA